MFSTIIGWLRGAFDAVVGGIKWLIDTFASWFKSIFQWIWDLICQIGTIIYDFFFHETDGWVWWFVDYFLDLFDWFIKQLPDVCSYVDDYGSSFSTLMSVVGKMNNFFPVHESVTLLGVFILFVGIFLGVKAILKLIPGIG
jgi:hypothetical protein